MGRDLPFHPDLPQWGMDAGAAGELLTATLAPAHTTRAAIDDLPGLRVMGDGEFIGRGLAHAHDPSRWSSTCRSRGSAATSPPTGCASTSADGMPRPKPVDLPTPEESQLETAMLPRDAFVAEVEQVSADQAVGRISAETVTPYPPGAPAVLPGEVVSQEVVDYVRSGLDAGMELPDPSAPELNSFRVVVRKP